MTLEPISLGRACSTKFQVCLNLYLRHNPKGSVERLREVLLFQRSAKIFPRHLFDWQVTPLTTVIAYLESDFLGVFEREDLYIDINLAVAHRRLQTVHPHEFEPADGVMNDAAVDAQYPAARAKFDHLADKFRRHLMADGPFLYVAQDAVDRTMAQRLVTLLSRWPNHRFQILFVHPDDEDVDLSGIDPRILQAPLGPTRSKPSDKVWEGDDDAWQPLLAPLDIAVPGMDRLTANLNPVPGPDVLTLAPVDLDWRIAPDWSRPLKLPADFAISSTAWDYSAASGPLEAPLGPSGGLVYVSVEALQGRFGLGLVLPDGSKPVGPEYCVDQAEGAVHLPLRLDLSIGPACIALRNFGDEGRESLARVHAVRR